MTRPLRSFEFPRSRRYYGSLRPCASLRYSHPWRASPWTSPLSSRRQVPTFRTRAWSTFTPPLCRVPPTQATGSPWTPPGLTTLPGSDTVPTLSTRCRWFIRFVSSGPHLMRSRRTFSVTLTTSALDRRSSRWFGARPCRSAPGGPPPSLVQQALSLDHLWPPRAVVAHHRQRTDRTRVRAAPAPCPTRPARCSTATETTDRPVACPSVVWRSPVPASMTPAVRYLPSPASAPACRSRLRATRSHQHVRWSMLPEVVPNELRPVT